MRQTNVFLFRKYPLAERKAERLHKSHFRFHIFQSVIALKKEKNNISWGIIQVTFLLISFHLTCFCCPSVCVSVCVMK